MDFVEKKLAMEEKVAIVDYASGIGAMEVQRISNDLLPALGQIANECCKIPHVTSGESSRVSRFSYVPTSLIAGTAAMATSAH